MRPKFPLAGPVCAALVLMAPFANATPYASGVNINAGIVTFVLNESADNVTVRFDGGASSQDMGALAAGTHTFNMGGATSFEIVVKKDSPAGYTQGVLNQISSDANVLNRFANQRGVAVNKNPNSPAFGRIYVSVSAAGTSEGRSLTEGIYLMNADQSEIATLGTNALTGGLNFATGGTESPHRITVGPDNNLYIGDWSDPSGTLYVTDANVANGQNVLEGLGGPCPLTSSRIHGSISGAWIEGSLATGDLVVYVIDEDLQTDRTAGCLAGAGTERNSIWRWDIGAGPLPATTPPTKFASPLIVTDAQLADLARGPDGKWYVSQRRAEPANSSGVFVRNPDGTALWSSLAATRTLFPGAVDILGETCAVDVSPDGKWMATLRRDTNVIVHLLPLIDGVPDITNRLAIQTFPSIAFGRDLGFDAAGNLYFVSSGQALLRVLSPGGNTTATTRSDGTFDVQVVPVPRVSVLVADADGAEDATDTMSFTLTRTGDLTEALTVNYTMSGVAQNGADYVALPLTVEFPAGEPNVTVTVTPIDDAVAEFTESVIFNVAPGSEYMLQSPTSATASILDNEFPTLRLTGGTKTNVFEPLPRDTMTVTVSRLGSLAADIFSVELIASGTATDVDDFVLSANGFPIEPGVITRTVTISPVNDFLLEGNESVTITLGSGSADYAIDAQSSVTQIIRDDELPGAVMFSETFDTNASSNWQIQFGANNGIYDASVDWVYDYSGLGIGPAPNTRDGSTVGLYAAVNKTDATALGSAGINFYPIGQNFSGDYALRFDMYLSFGAASTTEHALLGINHSGTKTNRASQSVDAGNSTAGGDGFWVGIVTDASNLRDYSGYTYLTPTGLPTVMVNRAASTLTGRITSPPYEFAGSPSSRVNNRSWAAVELGQVGNLITLKVNDIVIWAHQNTNSFTSGNIMIGMNDQFDSVGAVQTFVVFDNVRVVNLSADIEITGVELSANGIRILFTSPAGGAPGDYALQKKSNLAAPTWETDASAQITVGVGSNTYRATTTRSGDESYYRIVKP